MNRAIAPLTMLILASVAAACGPSSSNEDSTENKVTNIPETSVLDQGETGNCWLYATAAWTESLHASATGDTSIHFSPAYWDYWDWYDQIMGGAQQVQFGGFWGRAVEIISRYGLAPVGSLAAGDDAVTAVNANTTINQQLAAGVLGTGDAGTPPDPIAVLALLDSAFGISEDTKALLQTTFGPDGKQTFENGAQPAGFLVRPQDFDVATFNATTGKSTVKLSDIIGTAVDDDQDQRAGALAWTSAPAPVAATNASGLASVRPLPGLSVAKANALLGEDPADPDAGPAPVDPDAAAPTDDAGATPLPVPDPVAWTTYVRRIQRALNDGAPLPIAWLVVFDDADPTGHFKDVVASTASGNAGWHETLITDYEVTNVPGYGTLQAGVAASDDQKAAALLDPSTVTFLRVKNSWGTAPITGWAEPLAGYNDLDVSYLSATVELCDPSGQCGIAAPSMWDVVLPPGY